MAKTTIPVMYRDGANWKEFATYIGDGSITPEQIKALSDSLDVDGTFIPTQIGQRHLGASMAGFPGPDDHVWHEMLVDDIQVFDDLDNRSGLDGEHVGPVDQFVAAMVAAARDGWDDTVEP